MNKIRTLNNETTQEELYSYPKRLDKLEPIPIMSNNVPVRIPNSVHTSKTIFAWARAYCLGFKMERGKANTGTSYSAIKTP
jgi:hypothetical protein